MTRTNLLQKIYGRWGWIMKLLVAGLFSLLLISCSSSTDSGTGTGTGDDQNNDTNEPTTEEVTEEQALDALLQVLEDAGITFPCQKSAPPFNIKSLNLIATDYVTIDTSPNGLLQIQLWLDDEGQMIPTPDWQQQNQNVCLDQNKNMRAAVRMLQFQIHPTSHEVQLNYMEIGSGKITESVKRTADPDAASWLVDAMQKAWDAMQDRATIKDRVGPCYEMELQIEFESKITTDLSVDGQPIVYFEHVLGSFGLTLNEETNLFYGSGQLTWLAYEFNGTPGDNNPTGQLQVVNLHTPWGEGTPYDEPTLALELPSFVTVGTPMLTIAWPSLYEKELDEQNQNYKYIITGWEIPSDEPSVVMRKQNSRSKTITVEGETATITEETTIVIRR